MNTLQSLENQIGLDTILRTLETLGYIIIFVERAIKAVQYIRRRKATTKQVSNKIAVAPGYYRQRVTIILVEVLLLPVLALLALIYSEQSDFFGRLIFYMSTICIVWIVLTIPLSIFATLKKW